MNLLIATLAAPLATAGLGALPGPRRPKAVIFLAGLAATFGLALATARRYLSGRKITEALLNHVEVAIRAFDPCLSCATHALGRMPLELELADAGGASIDRLVRDASGRCHRP